MARTSGGRKTPPKLFVSYAFVDREVGPGRDILGRLLDDVRRHTSAIVYDGRLPVGTAWLTGLNRRITSADYFIFVLSQFSANREWPSMELELAYANQLKRRSARLMAVRIDHAEPPRLLRSFPIIDLTGDYEAGLRQLLQQLPLHDTSPLVQFEIDAPAGQSPIIDVSGRVNDALLEYFAKHPSALKTMDRRLFEELVAEVWRRFGYDVELTRPTRDGGRDVIAINNREVRVKYLIECKRPDPGHPVGVRPVRELYGVKQHEQATKAILATTAHFTRDALLFFENHRWELEPRDYDGILHWIGSYKRRRSQNSRADS